ncbi:MAG: hypothetical protein IKU53_05130 [Firmicutes bacterium]|nr:hypothetical protein [Bacillota bacterium]
MDTKLKKSNKVGYFFYCLAWIIATASATVVFVTLSVIVALEEMLWLQDYPADPEEGTHYFAGEITNLDNFNHLMELGGWFFIAGCVVFLALLVAIMFATGRFNKTEDGKIKLNWFDKIWSELHIVGCIVAGVLCFLPAEYLTNIWEKGVLLGVWNWYNPNDERMYGTSMEIFVMIVGIVFGAVLCMACFIALFKKLKAGEFWEKSLLGGSFFLILRAIKKSDKTMFKVMTVLIVGAILCATWVGTVIVIVLIIFLVPKMVEEYLGIKKGVEEVKNGNLTYKIPVTEDAKGVRGEFARLASDINDISQASNIAIQNELKSQRMKTELISNVSHDLKTPLTSMVSYIHLLKQEGLDSPNAPGYLEILDNKTQRLKVLTENLFEAAKASSGEIPVNMANIDLSSILTQTLVEMEERLAARNLTVQLKGMEENHRVMADGQLLWRVFENVLGNVSKYALENSRVYINVSEHNVGENGLIKIEVKNISKEELNISADELMERFKRGDESRNTEGSGLGLAIAKDLVKMMNGVFEITVDGDLFKATVMLEKAN